MGIRPWRAAQRTDLGSRGLQLIEILFVPGDGLLICGSPKSPVLFLNVFFWGASGGDMIRTLRPCCKTIDIQCQSPCDCHRYNGNDQVPAIPAPCNEAEELDELAADWLAIPS